MLLSRVRTYSNYSYAVIIYAPWALVSDCVSCHKLSTFNSVLFVKTFAFSRFCLISIVIPRSPYSHDLQYLTFSGLCMFIYVFHKYMNKIRTTSRGRGWGALPNKYPTVDTNVNILCYFKLTPRTAQLPPGRNERADLFPSISLCSQLRLQSSAYKLNSNGPRNN